MLCKGVEAEKLPIVQKKILFIPSPERYKSMLDNALKKKLRVIPESRSFSVFPFVKRIKSDIETTEPMIEKNDVLKKVRVKGINNVNTANADAALETPRT